MSQFASMMAAADHADPAHEGCHETVAKAMAASAPAPAQSSINDLIARARAAQIPWGKIMMALATAALGGFTPASIAAALALLFGTAPTP